ncbi:Sperm-tail PG-rich repeat-containing protein 2 [Triplophysa tibetana]|uniref:Sperm-tail PG-rich repeat-containing protein 2 n=1 Tax=Triplophysa tibetana TaxID=1572043 RepID=A0A5A9P6T2_9TELE|nr:Sperm-tail PG-rich repeat-containing protein 2 [Triplophysa tibetana]
MYDRAPRLMLNSSTSDVGPGSYNISRSLVGKVDSYAPFLSLCRRDPGFLRSSSDLICPGPGQYNSDIIRSRIVGGNGLQNRSKRFEDVVSDVPGPGAYDVSPAGKRTNHAEKSLRKYKGVNFSRMMGRRDQVKDGDGPGPGQYEPQEDHTALYENVNLRREQRGRPELILPRYHELIAQQEEKKRFSPMKDEAPPVGAYDDPRGALDALKKPRAVNKSPFGLSAVRFLPENRVNATPGPGSYNVYDYSLAQESLKKANLKGKRNGAFGCVAPRQLFHLSKEETQSPGPACYKVSGSWTRLVYPRCLCGCLELSHYLSKNASRTNRVICAEHSHTSQMKETPLAVFVKTYEEFYKKRSSAAFKSATERLVGSLCAQDTPPPGSYNVCESFEKIHGTRRYSEPRSENARNRHSSFLSAAPRDLAFVHSDPHIPGDRSYGEHTHLFMTRVALQWPVNNMFMCSFRSRSLQSRREIKLDVSPDRLKRRSL